MTYYDKEFQKLGTLPADMKLINEHGSTVWLYISPAEIEAILEVLNRKEVEK